jgi:steroid delta-isomerase-like uncharacterized protein
MPAGDAKSLVLGYIEQVWNGADPAAFDNLTGSSYAYSLGGQPVLDRDAMKQFLQAVRVAFPDWQVKVEDIIEEKGTVAVRWNCSGTHKGVFRGIPPTGRRISSCGINIYLVEDGRISREWEQMDSLGMLQQLGVMPPPKPQS